MFGEPGIKQLNGLVELVFQSFVVNLLEWVYLGFTHYVFQVWKMEMDERKEPKRSLEMGSVSFKALNANGA